MKKIAKLALVAVAFSAAAFAKDYRVEKPEAWKAKTVESAIKALYGDVKPVDSADVKVSTPEVASNGGQVPVSIKVGVPAKSVALFQDANPESLVAVWNIEDNMVPNLALKIKMKKTGSITVVVEGKDGKFYKAKRSFEVALSGCEG